MKRTRARAGQWILVQGGPEVIPSTWRCWRKFGCINDRGPLIWSSEESLDVDGGRDYWRDSFSTNNQHSNSAYDDDLFTKSTLFHIAHHIHHNLVSLSTSGLDQHYGRLGGHRTHFPLGPRTTRSITWFSRLEGICNNYTDDSTTTRTYCTAAGSNIG